MGGPGDPERMSLLDTLVAAGRRGGDVRIVLNGGLLLDTMPALRRAIEERGATGTLRLRSIRAILDAYLDAIANARSFVYLESQYFSARPIAGAMRRALDATSHGHRSARGMAV